MCGEGRGGGGTSRGRSGPGLGGGSPASAGRRRFKSASCVKEEGELVCTDFEMIFFSHINHIFHMDYLFVFVRAQAYGVNAPLVGH